jgi:hypothetical protein
MSWFRHGPSDTAVHDDAVAGDPVGRDLRALADGLEPDDAFARALEARLRRVAASRGTRRRVGFVARARCAWVGIGTPVRALATLATILTLLVGGAWAVPGARAGVGWLACLIPGLGIRDCDPAALVMAAPATTTRDGMTATVTRLISSGGQTRVRVEIVGIPAPPPAELPGGVKLALLDDQGVAQGQVRGSSAQGILPTGTMGNETFGYAIEGTFPALMGGTRAVTVRIAGPVPLGTWAIRVPVAPAGEAALAIPGPGGAAVALHGITLHVASVAADPGGLALRVIADADPATGVVQAIRRDLYPGYLELRDDRGRTYRERQPPYPDAPGNTAGPLTSDVLLPPLPADARAGTLLVPFVKLREPGTSTAVTIPIGSRPMGELITLDLPVTVGAHTFRVTGATLVDDRGPKIILKVDLGDWRGGRKLVEPGWATIDGRRAGGATRWGGDVSQAIELSIYPTQPVGNEVMLSFQEPVVAVVGPWELDVPLPGSR